MICTTAQNYVSITNILPQQELYMNVLSERIITITVLFVTKNNLRHPEGYRCPTNFSLNEKRYQKNSFAICLMPT